MYLIINNKLRSTIITFLFKFILYPCTLYLYLVLCPYHSILYIYLVLYPRLVRVCVTQPSYMSRMPFMSHMFYICTSKMYFMILPMSACWYKSTTYSGKSFMRAGNKYVLSINYVLNWLLKCWTKMIFILCAFTLNPERRPLFWVIYILDIADIKCRRSVRSGHICLPKWRLKITSNHSVADLYGGIWDVVLKKFDSISVCRAKLIHIVPTSFSAYTNYSFKYVLPEKMLEWKHILEVIFSLKRTLKNRRYFLIHFNIWSF